MSTSPKTTPLVFFGTDAFSIPSLIRLLAEDWNVVAVVTKPDAPTGRGRIITSPAVKRLAEARNIPVLQPHNLSDSIPELSELGATCGIVVAYGKIIPIHVLKLFPEGLLNVHASLLPKYRGASPIESALLNGDLETGVTLMQIEAGLDTGPTYEAAPMQLDGTQTRPQLYEHLAEMGADLLATWLPSILQHEIIALPQDEAEATITTRITKAAGIIDWNQPSEAIERHIRAYLDWPGSRTTIQNTDVIITAAHIVNGAGSAGRPFVTPEGDLAVYCGQGALAIDTIKPAGKNDMSGRQFLLGHPIPN